MSKLQLRVSTLALIPDGSERSLGSPEKMSNLEGEAEAQGENAQALVFAWSGIDTVIDAYRPDRQVVPDAATDGGGEIVKRGAAGSACVHEGCSDQIPKNWDIIFYVEDRSGQSADRVIVVILGAEFRLIEASNRCGTAIEKAFIDGDSSSPLDGIYVTKSCPKRQERFAQTEIGRISSRDPSETGASVKTL